MEELAEESPTSGLTLERYARGVLAFRTTSRGVQGEDHSICEAS